MDPLFQLTSSTLPFLMLLNNSVETTTLPVQNDTLTNATVDATPLKIPTDFSSLLAFIYSISALRDYLKLIVLGGAVDTLRRLYSASYRSLVDRFFITATFESGDASFGERPFPHCRSPS
jgi:mitochondrial chaperone BCS1